VGVTTVAVVGGGLTGLAAAWELRGAGAEVAVLESGRRAGGVIVTERRDGFVVEGGPDGFLAAEPDIQVLARELGIGDRLVDPLARGSMLWNGSEMAPLAEGQAAALLGIEGQTGVDVNQGFRSFKGGMGDVVEALLARLGSAVRTGMGVTGIAPSRRGYRLSLSGGSAVEAEAVVLALPAWAAARLLAALGVVAARRLEDVLYYPSVTVSLAYEQNGFARKLRGTGFISAGQPGAAVRACTYASFKYPGRAPEGYALLRAFVAPLDGDPASVAHAELAKILGVTGAPLWSRAFHWTRGVPRYKPRHAEHVATMRELLSRLPPLEIAGAGVDGAGVSACVKSGRAAARRLVERAGAPNYESPANRRSGPSAVDRRQAASGGQTQEARS